MKETWNKTMLERANVCTRAEDLVAYLYGEASETEARDFDRHMQNCAACRTELAAFGDVREAVGEWRQSALGVIPSTAFERDDVTAFASAKETLKPKRSALAAVREFFTLSPVWLRAATAAIALVFCVLAFIAIAHFKEQPKVVAGNEPNKIDTTQKKNDAVIAKQQEEPKNRTEKESPSQQPKDMMANNKPQAPKQIRNNSIGSPQLAKSPKRVLRRNLNDSDELAENDYLPFTAPSHEEKLPSLADLGEEPNQR